MGTAFPSDIDAARTIDPNDKENTRDHAGIHNDDHAAIIAIETAIGKTASTDTGSLEYRVAAAATALASKADLVAGKVPSSQLPSYVDDVLEFANLAAFPGTGETGKLYLADDTSLLYRWTGSAYFQLPSSPGTTDDVVEGSTNLYFTAARTRAVALSGLSTSTNASISATDSILAALGKLQAQINAGNGGVGGGGATLQYRVDQLTAISTGQAVFTTDKTIFHYEILTRPVSGSPSTMWQSDCTVAGNDVTISAGVHAGDQFQFSYLTADSGSVGATTLVVNTATVTWNPADMGANMVLSNGNLTVTKPTGSYTFALIRATHAQSAGLYYCEFHIDASGGDTMIGVCDSALSLTGYPGSDGNSYGFYELNGNIYHSAANAGSYGPAWSAGDVVGMALSFTTGNLWFHLNGVYPHGGDPAAGTNPAFTGVSGAKFPSLALYESSSLAKVTARFAPADWTYTAPAGFGAWTS